MAEFKTPTEIRNYPLSNGQTVDLAALVGTYSVLTEMDWMTPVKAPEIGTVVYVNALGDMRRGVVVKTTKTKIHVAVTTQGAIDSAAQAVAYGHEHKIRVQVVAADHNWVRVAPAVVEEPAETECPACGGPLASDGVCADDGCGAETEQLQITAETHAIGGSLAVRAPRETTGSAVVKMLERVYDRIRQNHPELPAVVMVTGTGADATGQKWGHFRANGWVTKAVELEGHGAATSVRLDEMFMAGETLAKGARQVLQTMLHEAAHTLAKLREVQDTSRQGRWHNAKFRELAGEMGLVYRKDKANPQIGYSEVVLTDNTLAEYADLLEELDQEIHLMVNLPFWLGGQAGGEEDEGGEGVRKPKGPAEPSSGNIKCVCRCEEPNIIRMSRKVLDMAVVNCGDCDALFQAA